jgi:hypothetical protein
VLQLYALDWKQFREWPVLPVALPERLLRDLPDTAGLEKVSCLSHPFWTHLPTCSWLLTASWRR